MLRTLLFKEKQVATDDGRGSWCASCPIDPRQRDRRRGHTFQRRQRRARSGDGAGEQASSSSRWLNRCEPVWSAAPTDIATISAASGSNTRGIQESSTSASAGSTGPSETRGVREAGGRRQGGTGFNASSASEAPRARIVGSRPIAPSRFARPILRWYPPTPMSMISNAPRRLAGGLERLAASRQHHDAFVALDDRLVVTL